MSRDELHTNDTRGFNFVGVGAGHKVLSDQAQENKRERGRGRPRGVIMTIAGPITRNGSTNISIPPPSPSSSSLPPHGTTFGGVACVIFLSAEITHCVHSTYACAPRIIRACMSAATEKPPVKYERHNHSFRRSNSHYRKCEKEGERMRVFRWDMRRAFSKPDNRRAKRASHFV